MKEKKDKDFCTFYLVRHGETDWNVKGLIQGKSDIPLNKKGEEQARQLAKKLRPIKFTAIFSSDLLRAKKTAEIIALEKKLTVVTKQVLRERDFDGLEGKPNPWLDAWRKMLREGIEKLTEAEKKQLEILRKKHRGVESNESLIARFIPFLREVALVYPGKNVLIVTHGSVIRTFLTKIGYFASEEESFKYSIENTSCFIIKSDGVEFFVK